MMKSLMNNALQLYTPLQRTNRQAHLRRPPARRATFLLLLGCLCLGLAISWRVDTTEAAIFQASPPTLVVNNTGDTNDANFGNGVCADSSNNCTLRAATQEAGSLSFATGATVNINFSVTGTIALTLNSGVNRTLFPFSKININGPGANLLTVDANGPNRVFYIVNAGGTASNISIKGLTLKGGDVSNDIGDKGGVIYQTGSSASLALDSVVLTGGTAGEGGGLSVESGTFTIANSTISGNTALGSCGGVFLNFSGNLTITNSTISGNNSVDHGGGICNQSSTVTIRKSTITLNQAGSGGGIHNYLGGNLTLGNSVVAGNTGLFATPRPDIWNEPMISPGGSFTDEGYNIVGKLDGANDAGTVFAPGQPNSNHDYVGTIASPVNARLAPLAGNGGPTQTHALLAGSLAIDHGTAVSGVTTDQRGQPRPFDNTFVASASGGDGSDIGAFEEQSSLDPGPTQLTLGNYPNSTVSLSADANVTPDAAPTNATGIRISTSISFKGTFAADPTTGLVRVTNASPAGTYAVTVTAFNGDGETTSKTFQLTVQAGVSCTGTSFFTNATDVAIAPNPFFAAVGDFNRDGNQDLVISNSDNSGGVSIRLGTGSGGFTSAPTVSIGVGNRPAGVAVGDFNGDGKPDLAIANNASTTVMILLGDGAGGFSSPIAVGVGTNPISVAVGDFNNDGKQDLAVGNFMSANVSVRLGDGVGGFGGSTNVGVGTRPYSVAVGDFNNDGKQDFAAANSLSNNLSIRLGDGAGNFSNAPDVGALSDPRSVAVGDFNGDGKQDLAAGNNTSTTVSIRLGDGAGNFSGSTNVGVGSGPFSVAIGDFNNDGRQDFAAANALSSTVSIRLGDGSGGFSGSNVGVGPNTLAVVVGDFNQDGKQDFAAANAGSSTVSIRLGGCDAAPTITAAAGLSRQPGSPATNAQIATVTDEAGDGHVVVTVTSANPLNGVTISNIVNTNGTVTADIVADCTASDASFTLQAAVGTTTSTATLNIMVTANTGPVLTYANQTVALNGSTTINPATAPTDNGSVSTIVLQSAGTYSGMISVDNTTGIVSISNAAPVGTHSITIRATDDCGAITDATFTLLVTDLPNECTSIVVSGGWNSAATWGCGHVPTGTDAVVIQPGHNVTLDINPLASSITVNGTLTVGSGGATLVSDLQVNGTLSFASGSEGANNDLSPQVAPDNNNLITGNNIVTVACAGAITGPSASGFVVGNVKKNYCATGAFTFPVGTDTNGNEYSPVNVNVTALDMNPSSLTVKTTRGTAPATPPLLDPITLDRYWTLTESGDLTADVTFNYLPSDVTAPEGDQRIIRITNSSPVVWPNSAPDTVNHKATATGVSAFSDWTLSQPAAPTASDGTVTGRIVDDQGNPVEGVVVRLSGAQDRKFITDANGFYRFDNVETGGFYTITPFRANYAFSPVSRSFIQLGNHTEAVFSASSSGETTNPLDTPEYFVRQQYVDVLGREPEEGGFNYWSDQILACGPDTACVNARRRAVAAAFFVEQEFQQSGAFIFNLYKSGFGRRPAFNEYSFDRQAIVGGATLETEKAAFARAFVARAEFIQRYAQQTTAESFVDALIQQVQQFTGVNLSTQRSVLISRYNSGGNQIESRSLVLRDVAENAVFKQAEYNAAFVLIEYFAYLKRNPDQGGYDFWLNVLNNREPGNYLGMVCSFISSVEYQQRFSSIVSHGNSECGQ